MGDIIDLIFSNLGILLPIIVGIFAFVTNQGKEEDKEKKQQKPKAQQNTQSSSKSFQQPADSSNEGKDLKTYAEEQRERYRSLQREQKAESQTQSKAEKEEPVHDAIPDQPTQPSYQREEKVPYRKQETSPQTIQVTGIHKVSQKKLAESIVMAEVLGKPRAMRPYRSHLKK